MTYECNITIPVTHVDWNRKQDKLQDKLYNVLHYKQHKQMILKYVNRHSRKYMLGIRQLQKIKHWVHLLQKQIRAVERLRCNEVTQQVDIWRTYDGKHKLVDEVFRPVLFRQPALADIQSVVIDLPVMTDQFYQPAVPVVPHQFAHVKCTNCHVNNYLTVDTGNGNCSQCGPVPRCVPCNRVAQTPQYQLHTVQSPFTYKTFKYWTLDLLPGVRLSLDRQHIVDEHGNTLSKWVDPYLVRHDDPDSPNGAGYYYMCDVHLEKFYDLGNGIQCTYCTNRTSFVEIDGQFRCVQCTVNSYTICGECWKKDGTLQRLEAHYNSYRCPRCHSVAHTDADAQQDLENEWNRVDAFVRSQNIQLPATAAPKTNLVLDTANNLQARPHWLNCREHQQLDRLPHSKTLVLFLNALELGEQLLRRVLERREQAHVSVLHYLFQAMFATCFPLHVGEYLLPHQKPMNVLPVVLFYALQHHMQFIRYVTIYQAYVELRSPGNNELRYYRLQGETKQRSKLIQMLHLNAEKHESTPIAELQRMYIAVVTKRLQQMVRISKLSYMRNIVVKQYPDLSCWHTVQQYLQQLAQLEYSWQQLEIVRDQQQFARLQLRAKRFLVAASQHASRKYRYTLTAMAHDVQVFGIALWYLVVGSFSRGELRPKQWQLRWLQQLKVGEVETIKFKAYLDAMERMGIHTRYDDRKLPRSVMPNLEQSMNVTEKSPFDTELSAVPVVDHDKFVQTFWALYHVRRQHYHIRVIEDDETTVSSRKHHGHLQQPARD